MNEFRKDRKQDESKNYSILHVHLFLGDALCEKDCWDTSCEEGVTVTVHNMGSSQL